MELSHSYCSDERIREGGGAGGKNTVGGGKMLLLRACGSECPQQVISEHNFQLGAEGEKRRITSRLD